MNVKLYYMIVLIWSSILVSSFFVSKLLISELVLNFS